MEYFIVVQQGVLPEGLGEMSEFISYNTIELPVSEDNQWTVWREIVDALDNSSLWEKCGPETGFFGEGYRAFRHQDMPTTMTVVYQTMRSERRGIA